MPAVPDYLVPTILLVNNVVQAQRGSRDVRECQQALLYAHAQRESLSRSAMRVASHLRAARVEATRLACELEAVNNQVGPGHALVCLHSSLGMP